MVNIVTFGEDVIAQSEILRQSGLDANQIAGLLCKKDPQGQNYGIGILLGKDGKPLPTSPTLLSYVERELKDSAWGSYINSDALKEEMREAVLRWQGIPEALWPHFQLLLPSDAGTGAVQTAIQAMLLFKDTLATLAVEELGWPAYKAIASSVRLRFQEFPADGVARGEGVLPLYQAGPLNTTGRVPSKEVVKARVDGARSAGAPVVLDRAYSGFEYAQDVLAIKGAPPDAYSQLMRKSFAAQVQPFVDAGVPFGLAISPTKAFVTFSLRPCGLLLIFQPDLAQGRALSPKLNGLIRARGSSFEHPITRAFVKAMIRDRAKLEGEHAQALRRNAEAEHQWKSLTRGTAMEALFSDSYGGLFRNPRARPEAAREIYGAHIYPVFADGRCRVNVTGLPSDSALAEKLVSLFSKYCY